MRYLLWMGILLLLIDAKRTDIVEDRVDFIEINHRYNDNGMIMFDQIILWEWAHYPDGKKVAVVVDWYILDNKRCREQLTPEEYRVKNAAQRDQWIKDKKRGRAPPYVPKFKYTYRCPKYDMFRQRAIVVMYYKGVMRKIVAHSYYESWTLFDPEVDNQSILPSHKRRRLSGKRKQVK